MRTRIIAFSAALFFAPAAHAQPPVIAAVVIGSRGNLITGVDCPAGSALFAAAGANDLDTTVASLSDGTANVYLLLQNTPASGSYNSGIAYSLNLAHDVPIGSTISATETSGSNGAYVQGAVCVAGANSGLDKSASVVDTSSVSSFSLPTGTLSEANEIIFGEWVALGATAIASYTEASGFTAITTASAAVNIGFAYKIVTATTSVPYNPSNFSPTQTLTAVVASFKY
jgi:hypothetical protein